MFEKGGAKTLNAFTQVPLDPFQGHIIPNVIATPDFFAGTRIIKEKNSEKSEMQREHQRDTQNLRKEHKREIDVSKIVA